MSTHYVNIIEITEIRSHDNADKLEVIPIGGWQAVVKKDQFKIGDRAIYIQPDYTVPTSRPEFRFLAKKGKDRHRLKAIRLRGVLSYGLLIPVPEEFSDREIGTNVMSELDIERYEPPIVVVGADTLPTNLWPNVYSSKFDIESLQNFTDLIIKDEIVVVTEKIHGANARYVFVDDVFYMGSRNRWLKPDVIHHWKQAADNDPRIEVWCRKYPGVVLYGEIYGAVQSLKYGHKSGSVSFAAFAANDKGDWINVLTLINDSSIPTVPLIYHGPFDSNLILSMAEEDSTVYGAPSKHMREGIVIVPEKERRNEKIGRVAMKHISTRYWESAD